MWEDARLFHWNLAFHAFAAFARNAQMTAKRAKSGSKPGVTPMMQQYLDVKRGLPTNTVLLFRLGDFYEMFHDDAEEGARILGITLTQRQGYPMAGIPYHAAQSYIQKILAAGVKVAIVDQMEMPQPGKIVKRALTRILTPGTTLEDHQVEARRNQFLLAVDLSADGLAAAWLDLTTGRYEVAHAARPADLVPVMSSLGAREVLIPEGRSATWAADPDLADAVDLLDQVTVGLPRSELPDYQFDIESGAEEVRRALKVLSLEGFGIAKGHAALGCAGALIAYATETLCQKPENLTRLGEYRTAGSLLLDPATQRNLEIFRSSQGQREGSLIAAIDRAMTAPGARLLEEYLSAPSLDLGELKRRQGIVGELLSAPGFTSEIREYLKRVRDIPRILGRLQNRLRNPRELGAIRESLSMFPDIQTVCRQVEGADMAGLAERIVAFPELLATLESGLADNLPTKIDDGGYIRDGFSEKLDELRNLATNSKEWITAFEQREQERTGIKNLRIRYSGAFGYSIEVTKTNLDLVPDDYTRKQTMKNAERFVTAELKEKEREILNADEKIIALEEDLFRELVNKVLAEADRLRGVAEALAELDLFAGWAQLAREWDYCQPELDESDTIDIEEGRHPVVEQMMRGERHGLAGSNAFVPNDTLLSASGEQIALITGPNMAGKSTYIRQVALITLMAQVGCWVPAKSCRIGLVDRIFSRVGASDELARGNSTFMVEMNETANIINNTTDRSLIILDEIGRGTSTYDGLSIAWAVVEHLHGDKGSEAGPRTLFATHYHELTQIASQLGRVCNYCVSVKEWNDEIVFVRQVVRGAADRSYGIQVARLAGLPPTIISRAKAILEKLEADDSSHNLIRKQMKRRKADPGAEADGQLSLF